VLWTGYCQAIAKQRRMADALVKKMNYSEGRTSLGIFLPMIFKDILPIGKSGSSGTPFA